MQQSSTRAGVYVKQSTNYRAFVPAALPPQPPLTLDDRMLELLSDADRALGRLDGSAEVIPNPDLFVMMYVRKEAVLSSQIEGTQASLANVLELEAQVLDPVRPSDVSEIVNYISGLNHGLERLTALPISLRLVREIHAKLMLETLGHDLSPGEFRRTQNWIGPQGCTLANARFVPPAPDDMKVAMGDWEQFLHDERPMPYLIRVGLAHAQFETIHPFLDGNGRIGRLMITFLLCERKLLKHPLLYLSFYFKQNRQEYYDRLQAIRESGDWEGWLQFFLRGVAVVANEATEVARKIVALREEDRAKIIANGGRLTADSLKVHEYSFEHPIVNVANIQKLTGKEFPSANNVVRLLVELEILKETSGRARGRVYAYRRYLQLFDDSDVVGTPE